MKALILFIPFILLANHIHWLGDYNKAHKRALNEQKPLMIYLIKPDCNLCRDIIKNSFTDQKYIDKLNTNFIPVIVSYTKIRNYPNELYYSNDFPTLFFVDEKNETFLISPLKKVQINPKNIKFFLNTYH